MAIYTKAFEIQQGIDATTLDVTTFGQDFASFDILKAKSDFSLQAYLDDTYQAPGDAANQLQDKFWHGRVIDPATGLIVTTPAVLSTMFRKTPVEGSRALMMRAYGTFGIAQTPKGLSVVRFQASESGPIDYGYCAILSSQTFDESGPTVYSGPAVQLPAGTARKIRMSYHVVSYSEADAGAVGITWKMQSDDSGGFGSPSDQLTSGVQGITSPGGRYGYYEADISTTDNFWRGNITVSGASTWTSTLGIAMFFSVKY